jgi:hypothetical protein
LGRPLSRTSHDGVSVLVSVFACSCPGKAYGSPSRGGAREGESASARTASDGGGVPFRRNFFCHLLTSDLNTSIGHVSISTTRPLPVQTAGTKFLATGVMCLEHFQRALK